MDLGGRPWEKEKTPNSFIWAQGPHPVSCSRPGQQAFQIDSLGRKKPATRCPGSIKAECAPQTDAVFAQGGPLFLERIRGSGKTPLLPVSKSCFPRGCGAWRSKDLACLLPSQRRLSPGWALLCKPSKLLENTQQLLRQRGRNKSLLPCRPSLQMPSKPRVQWCISGINVLLKGKCVFPPRPKQEVCFG